ncbi:MAG: hypothetical protein E7673_02265 [Ruminococcaceae bacterium]|nr:hypothetical protein [Oscillospiraceae bacterium]
MKKTISFVLLLFVLLSSTGCIKKGYSNHEYSGEYSDLYTVAINSVLWNNGHSFSADQYADPKIEIIDSDEYGRILFTYYEKYYAGAGISHSALIVLQSSNEKEVFYYEDANYIVKEQTLYTQSIKAFESAEIEQLKLENDWNKEIKFDKCIKKEINKQKQVIPHEEEIKNRIVDEFSLIDRKYSLFTHFLTYDSSNSKFIIYGYIRIDEKEGTYFIALAESDKDSLKSLKFLVPLDVFDYKNDFIEFKEENNWYIE